MINRNCARVMALPDPLLVEESTLHKLSPWLEEALKDLDDNANHHDYFAALLIVLLWEAGFRISTDKANNTDKRTTQVRPRIPKVLKSKETGIYDITVHHHRCPSVDCKLLAVPTGDRSIVNFYPLIEDRRIFSMAVQCLKYINPFSSQLSGRYMNLREIAHRFKDNLVTPVRSDTLMSEGLPAPSLEGLPVEMQLKIISYLDIPSEVILYHSCDHFNQLIKIKNLPNLNT